MSGTTIRLGAAAWLALAAPAVRAAGWDPWTEPAPAPAPREPRLEDPGDAVRVAGLAAIRLYQLVLSPLLPSRCAFDPSCSRYAFACIARYGLINGTIMGADRITRCHSLAGLDGYAVGADGRFMDRPEDARPPLRWPLALGW